MAWGGGEAGLNRKMGEGFSKKAPAAQAFRCHCGSLLARLVPEGVELKCRRCKRQVVIPLESGSAAKRESRI